MFEGGRLVPLLGAHGAWGGDRYRGCLTASRGDARAVYKERTNPCEETSNTGRVRPPARGPRGLGAGHRRTEQKGDDGLRFTDYGLRITKMMKFSAEAPAHSGRVATATQPWRVDILNPSPPKSPRDEGGRQRPSEGGSSRRSAVPKPERKSKMFKQMISFAAVAGLVLALAGAAPAAPVEIIEALTGSGTWVVPAGVTQVSVLVVAGGGGGGLDGKKGPGGGAGGLIYDAAFSVTGSISYSVGAGGIGYGSSGGPTNGEDSVFGTLTAIGGGRGNASGGSGGGGTPGGTGASGTAGQGNAGGSGYDLNPWSSGGGGGAGAVGGDASASSYGIGGVGLDYSSVFGTTYGDSGWFAGGGTGGVRCSSGFDAYADGGQGGGGRGYLSTGGNPQYGSLSNMDGMAGTGGGGGGEGSDGGRGGYGGSGTILLSYVPEPASMALLLVGLPFVMRRKSR